MSEKPVSIIAVNSRAVFSPQAREVFYLGHYVGTVVQGVAGYWSVCIGPKSPWYGDEQTAINEVITTYLEKHPELA